MPSLLPALLASPVDSLDVKVCEMSLKHLARAQASPLQVAGNAFNPSRKAGGRVAHQLCGQAVLTTLGELGAGRQVESPRISSWGNWGPEKLRRLSGELSLHSLLP